jgi:hypothetical protein
MLVRFAPDCRFESPPAYVDAGLRSVYLGHAGAREQAADLREAWERMDIVPLEIVDAGNRFLILGHVHIRARGSGVELDSQIGVAYWVERGSCVRHSPFFDWDEALRAAGIPTQHSPPQYRSHGAMTVPVSLRWAVWTILASASAPE